MNPLRLPTADEAREFDVLKAALAYRNPEVAHLVMSLKLVIINSGSWASDELGHVYVNPDWEVPSSDGDERGVLLTKKQKLAALAHETLHVILNYSSRVKASPTLAMGTANGFSRGEMYSFANLAHDAEINPIVRDDMKLDLPSCAVFRNNLWKPLGLDSAYDHVFAAENLEPLFREIYEVMRDRREEQQGGEGQDRQGEDDGGDGQGSSSGSGQGQGKGSSSQGGAERGADNENSDGQGGGGGDDQDSAGRDKGEGGKGRIDRDGSSDSHDHGEETGCSTVTKEMRKQAQELAPGDADEVEAALDACAAAVKSMAAKGQSSALSRRLTKWAADRLEAPEADLLSGFYMRSVSAVHSRSSGSHSTWTRRSRRTAGLPSTMRMPGSVCPIVRVLIGVDVSGSMSDKDLIRAISEIVPLLLNPRVIVELFAVSTSRDAVIRPLRSTADIVLDRDQGGTDMRIAFDIADEHSCDVFILFTDGLTPWPELAPKNVGESMVCVIEPADHEGLGYKRQNPPTWAIATHVPASRLAA